MTNCVAPDPKRAVNFAHPVWGRSVTSRADGSFDRYNNFTQAARSSAGFYGNGGDDVLYGDVPTREEVHLVGGTGNNTLVGGAGRDTLFAHEGDNLLDGEDAFLQDLALALRRTAHDEPTVPRTEGESRMCGSPASS